MPFRTELIAVVAGIALAAVVALAWHWHGKSQYAEGYEQAQSDALIQQIEIERGMQYERDRADADYRGAVLARQTAERLVADQRQRIDGLLDQLRRRPKAPNSGTGIDGAGEDWIGIFAACVAEYDDMGRDAGRLADKVGGLQGYIRALNPPAQK
ncbi:MAG: hypothetical protein WC284_05250 [Candidimonas sp.]